MRKDETIGTRIRCRSGYMREVSRKFSNYIVSKTFYGLRLMISFEIGTAGGRMDAVLQHD